jgi:hypothetical protein
VAGAAILVQAWQRRTHDRVFDAWTLRALLSGSNNTQRLRMVRGAGDGPRLCT